MRAVLVALLLITAPTPANDETITVPKSSAEWLVQENLRLQQELRDMTEYAMAQRLIVMRLQKSLNCS